LGSRLQSTESQGSPIGRGQQARQNPSYHCDEHVQSPPHHHHHCHHHCHRHCHCTNGLSPSVWPPTTSIAGSGPAAPVPTASAHAVRLCAVACQPGTGQAHHTTPHRTHSTHGTHWDDGRGAPLSCHPLECAQPTPREHPPRPLATTRPRQLRFQATQARHTIAIAGRQTLDGTHKDAARRWWSRAGSKGASKHRSSRRQMCENAAYLQHTRYT
jgi:hypothetical protein